MLKRFCPFVGILHSPAIRQITLSSITLFLSESEVDCFHGLGEETLLQSFQVFYAPKKCLYFIKKKPVVLYFLTLSYFFFITMSYTNMNSDDHLGFYWPQLIMNAETLPCIYT
jgi:hypothetical protein